MEQMFVGYHGTKEYSAKRILNEGFKFSRNEEDWLGEGIYFFEDDIKQAYYFCVKAKKYNDWAIIKCTLLGEVLDLTKRGTMEEFEKIAKEIKDRYKKTKDNKPRQLLNSVIIEFIRKQKSFDIVRAIFPIPKKEGYVIERTNIGWYQIQLCAKNLNCIKKAERVSYDGS